MENIDEHITLIIGFIGHFWIWNFTYEVKTSYRPWENKGWKGTQRQEEVDIPRVAIFCVGRVVVLCCLCLNAFHHRVCFACCHVNVSLYSVCIFLLFIWFSVNSVPRILLFSSIFLTALILIGSKKVGSPHHWWEKVIRMAKKFATTLPPCLVVSD